MTNYSNKSNALRAARKIEGATVAQQDGKWVVVAPVAFEATEEELAAQTVRPVAEPEYLVADTATMTHNEIHDALCPGCGIHLSNGLLSAEDTLPNKDVTYYEAGINNREYECMGCGHQFGKESAPYVKPAAKVRGPKMKNGVSIQKVRATKNGVTRYSAGGTCDEMWTHLDTLYATDGKLPVIKQVAADKGWKINTATKLFGQWKKFNGLTK